MTPPRWWVRATVSRPVRGGGVRGSRARLVIRSARWILPGAVGSDGVRYVDHVPVPVPVGHWFCTEECFLRRVEEEVHGPRRLPSRALVNAATGNASGASEILHMNTHRTPRAESISQRIHGISASTETTSAPRICDVFYFLRSINKGF